MAADYCESELVENSKLKNHRPLLVVSSTSWTPDEDFHVLFSGLQKYDQSDTALPPLFVVITGKGPLKSYYEQEFIKLNLSRVKLFFAWLDFGDYAKLLACADFGVSLHTSSSGLDLPMKIVDMMGAGIPVFAYEFNCIREIIKHGQNGFVFNDGETLATLIVDFVQKSDRDLMFRQELSKFQEIGWDASWDKILLPRLGKQD